VLVDKIGACVMGVIAGLVASGVVAIAAQAMPFGPTMGLYGRYATVDKNGAFSGNLGQAQEVKMSDVMVSDNFDPIQESHLTFEQDDLVVGLTERLSDGGSLAGDQPLVAIHPDYLTELFGERVGIQVGARHTIVNTPSKPVVAAAGVYTQDQLTQVDGELPDMSVRDQKPAPILHLDSASGQTMLIVRLNLTGGKELSDDSDSLLRFSPGSVRLVAGRMTSHGADYRDYYPCALLNPRGIAVACRVDDYLLVPANNGNRTIDFIFVVDDDYAFSGDKPYQIPYTLNSGTFLCMKRYGIVDLSDLKVNYGPPFNPDRAGIMRPATVEALINKTEVLTLQEPPGVLAPGSPTKPGAELANVGLKFMSITVSNRLPDPINVHGENTGSGNVELASVRGDYSNRQWQHLYASVDLINVPTTIQTNPPASQDASSLPTTVPDNVVELATGPRTAMLQLHCTPIFPPNVSGDKAWGWTNNVDELLFVDRNGTTYRPAGVWARSKELRTQRIFSNGRRFEQRYEQQILAVSFGNDAAKDIPKSGVPTDVWIAYRVPADTVIREVRFRGNTVMENLSVTAK
jgi:hypothetical protein